jgi:putative hemolysin
VRSLAEEGRRGSAALFELKQNPEKLLATILIGNNVVNIGAASYATALALRLFGSQGVAYATGAMTLLVLVFGEITPKGLASANNVRFGLIVAPLILFLSRVLYPAVLPLEALTRWFVYRSNRVGAPTVTEGEIREMTAIGHKEGSIDERERQIIERAFWLDEKRAWDIMTPRVEIFGWAASRSLRSIASELKTLRFSRIPVFGESIDDVVGVLYTRDAYQALVSGQRDVPIRELAREPLFVPGSIPLTKLLSEFQTRRIHMGLVIDEYGGTDGLVTLEDILEELVGEIVDETDIERQPILRISRHEIEVLGGADLREINHFFNSAFPQLEHRSFNGYLLDELGYVPKPGEEVEREGITIRVVDASETQVQRARLIRPIPKEAESAAGEGEGRGEAGDGGAEPPQRSGRR